MSLGGQFARRNYFNKFSDKIVSDDITSKYPLMELILLLNPQNLLRKSQNPQNAPENRYDIFHKGILNVLQLDNALIPQLHNVTSTLTLVPSFPRPLTAHIVFPLTSSHSISLIQHFLIHISYSAPLFFFFPLLPNLYTISFLFLY